MRLMKTKDENLSELFAKCKRSIMAMGDENRQAVILTLLDGPCEGMRVGDIKEHSHLSQPAVSHHLKILLEANLLTVRKEGTMNYYRLNPDRAEITNIYNLCGAILTWLDKQEIKRDIN